MSTFTVVDEIKLKAPTWSRDGSRSILAMMNRAQNFLFSRPCLLSVYVDPATGDYPWLVTTAGNRDYEIPNVPFKYNMDSDVDVEIETELRIHTVREVFSENVYPVNDYGLRNINPYMTMVGKKIIWSFTPKPATQNTKARIIFPFDPGSFTERYKLRQLVEPLQLTADDIPLMIQQDDEWIIIDGALGYIEYFDYGRSDRMDKFEKEHAHVFWNKYKGIETIRKTEGVNRRKF